MPKLIDLTGQRFGRLTVEAVSHKKKRRYYWLCLCDCGNSHIVQGSKLKNGCTKSCGCLKHDHGKLVTHGMSGTPIYNSWNAMQQRCFNENDEKYSRYGGRGITVCDRWRKFENFYQDMGERPEGYSIDRIDNDGIYEPDNCRWATSEQQSNNTSRNKLITFNGVTQSISEWAKEKGIKQQTLSRRLNSGWPIEKSLTTIVVT